ncbi:unnamed protein product [Merluccius merluccius]
MNTQLWLREHLLPLFSAVTGASEKLSTGFLGEAEGLVYAGRGCTRQWEEAATDVKARALPVSVITLRESLAEWLSCSAWETVGGPRQPGTGEEQERNIKERLQALRRQPSSPPEEQ